MTKCSPRAVLEIVAAEPTGDGRLAVIARCLAPTRLGAHLRHEAGITLVITEIRRYAEVTVPELDPPHGARLMLAGEGAAGLRLVAGDVLHGVDPAG